MARLRNKATGLFATCDDELAEKYLAKGWVLASEYVELAPNHAPAATGGEGAAAFDVDAVAVAVAGIVLARLAETSGSASDSESGADDSAETQAETVADAADDSVNDEAPARRGQARRKP